MQAKSKPNRLFRILVILSLGIHALIFARISEVFTSHNLTFIELTLQDISNPTTRTIPRPRPRPKKAPLPMDVSKITHPKRFNRFPKPIQAKSVEVDYPGSLVEGINGPDVSDLDELGFVKWDPSLEPYIEYDSVESYFEMVTLRIEREKKYPKSAMDRQLEGRITLQFVITRTGEVDSIQVVKKSRHDLLNQAALAAVKNAGPFQKPPSRFFKGDITLKITINFELT